MPNEQLHADHFHVRTQSVESKDGGGYSVMDLATGNFDQDENQDELAASSSSMIRLVS